MFNNVVFLFVLSGMFFRASFIALQELMFIWKHQLDPECKQWCITGHKRNLGWKISGLLKYNFTIALVLIDSKNREFFFVELIPSDLVWLFDFGVTSE